jgi:uncharacterized protein YndB with AHSA1/START domain
MAAPTQNGVAEGEGRGGMDITGEINVIHRRLDSRSTPAGDGNVVVLRRTYDAPVEDVWDALTDPERLARWFLPLAGNPSAGDLRLGAKYQLEGNAGGEILQCEPPRLLKVSWLLGGHASDSDFSEVEVRLSPESDGRTLFELEHAAVVDPGFWSQFGPGAVGVGWDLTLLGLGLHLNGGLAVDRAERAAWEESAEAREFIIGSSKAWRAAHEAGGATAEEAASAAANTKQFYAPDPD